MWTNWVRKSLLALASSSEFLEKVAIGLVGTEVFYELVRDEVRDIVSELVVKQAVRGLVDETVREAMRDVVVAVQDNDILIIPSEGISGREFERLATLIPNDKRIGVVAASDVKILRLT